MKKGLKVLGLLVLGLVFTSMIVGAVSAAGSAQGIIKTIWDAFFEGINISGLLDNTQLAHALLLLLTALLVYSIADFLPFIPANKWIKGGFALIVGALAFLFIDTQTIKDITDTYGALGVALTSIIPLLILLAFSFKLSSDAKFAPYASFIDKFMFLIFGLWMILKWGSKTDTAYRTAYLTSAVVAFVWIFIGKAVKRFALIKQAMSMAENRGATSRGKQIEKLVGELEELNKNIRSAGGPASAPNLVKEYDEKAEQIRKLGVTNWGPFK